MTQVFKLPDLGEGLTEAEIVEWHVAEGDEVTIDQNVVTVETAKAAVEVPCPYAGTVVTLHGDPGSVLEVGTPLITIGGEVAGNAEAPAPAGGEQYRHEERAGAKVPAEVDGGEPVGEVQEQAERPLIGFGAGDGPARRSRRRNPRRAAPPAAAAASPAAAAASPAPAAASPAPAPVVARKDSGAPAPHSLRTNSSSHPDAVKVISPLVRKLAAEAGVDLSSLQPTGAGGVVRRADVEAAVTALGANGHAGSTSFAAAGLGAGATAGGAAAGGPAAAPTAADTAAAISGGQTRVPLAGIRRVIADKLTTSRREIPEANVWVDADATELIAVKDALKTAAPESGIGILPLMARIVVTGLQRFPDLNSSIDSAAGEIVLHHGINLGIAAQSPRGLVVPVVHGADKMTTTQLAATLKELTTKAREGTLSPAELTGGTFTLNNYGVFGTDGSTPIINHPEAAMLGVGRIIDKPWAHEGQVALRKMTVLSFAFDHRVCDGGVAGGFLRFVADCVEQPAVLLANL